MAAGDGSVGRHWHYKRLSVLYFPFSETTPKWQSRTIAWNRSAGVCQLLTYKYDVDLNAKLASGRLSKTIKASGRLGGRTPYENPAFGQAETTTNKPYLNNMTANASRLRYYFLRRIIWFDDSKYMHRAVGFASGQLTVMPSHAFNS